MKIKKIGFDIDDTLTRSEDFVVDTAREWYLREFGRNLPGPIRKEKYSFEEKSPSLTKRECDLFMTYYFPIGVKECPFRPGVQTLFKRLKELGYGVEIVTRRDDTYNDGCTSYKGPVMKADTLERFKKNNLFPDKFHFRCFDKLDAMEKNDIDILVEDHPSNINRVATSRPVIIMTCGWNRGLETSPDKHTWRIENFDLRGFVKILRDIEGTL